MSVDKGVRMKDMIGGKLNGNVLVHVIRNSSYGGRCEMQMKNKKANRIAKCEQFQVQTGLIAGQGDKSEAASAFAELGQSVSEMLDMVRESAKATTDTYRG